MKEWTMESAKQELMALQREALGEAPCGELIAGEVSKVNDDNTDNYFLEETFRFSEIVEDEAILHPLCNEYNKVL